MAQKITQLQKIIYEVRGYQIMLDADLSRIYNVETKVLNQAVKRNIDRFPPEFMFQLTKDEYENLKSQFVTSSLRSQIVTSNWGGRRKLPFAFTEHGVIMLLYTQGYQLPNLPGVARRHGTLYVVVLRMKAVVKGDSHPSPK